MKILLDECLPVDFRHSFPTHDAHTAQWAGFKGKGNGELLRAAEKLRVTTFYRQLIREYLVSSLLLAGGSPSFWLGPGPIRSKIYFLW